MEIKRLSDNLFEFETAVNKKLKTIPAASLDYMRNVYSETEKVVGTWIDGKPIYQKTLTGTFEAENNILSIQAPNYTLAILSASGFLLHTNETDTITINGCFDVTQTYCVVFHSITDNGILIKRYSTSAGGSTPTAYVTIQYVKTT